MAPGLSTLAWGEDGVTKAPLFTGTNTSWVMRPPPVHQIKQTSQYIEEKKKEEIQKKYKRNTCAWWGPPRSGWRREESHEEERDHQQIGEGHGP